MTIPVYGPQRQFRAAVSKLLNENVSNSTPGGLKGRVEALEALYWDDLKFPANGINPIGGTADPTRITDEAGFCGCLSFSGSTDNLIAGVAQMPHAWKDGTAIKPHIHWTKPTGSSNAVTWEFYYRFLGNVGDTAGAWVGPISGTLAAGTQTTSDNHLLTAFGSITMTGKKDSTMLGWRVYRRGSSDAESNAVVLFEFDIHYQSDARGSTAEYPS